MKQLAAIYQIKDLSKFSLVTTYIYSRAAENDFCNQESRVKMSKTCLAG